jgi:hypothetical protein
MMRTALGRLTRAAAGTMIVVTAVALAGCSFAVVPPKKHPTPPAKPGADQAANRLRDAPALLVQCAISRAGLRPGNQDWLHGNKVFIDTTNATNFESWWLSNDTPGPYHQTFVIDGHRTHYLAYGATWVKKNGQWVPTHTARNDPLAQRTSLYAWSLWAAQSGRLPVLVCGPSASARQLNQQIFGSSTPNPW